jgi:sugar transferase EpsL
VHACPVAGMSMPGRFYERLGKRGLDAAASTITLVLLSPLLAGIVVVVRMTMGSPVFFRQERPGRDGRPFNIVKFRTMTDERDSTGHLVPDAERLRPLGRWLRKTSLDELPELLNVIKGDMSLVGPRPLLMEYLPLYSLEQRRRHQVRPGITGLAQVRGRNALTWAQKFALDVWYVDHLSFGLDVRILFETIRSVMHREGISAEAHATMPKFTGGPE